ncbi:hypothetical protein F0U61_37450 [Archangium violaceum]|uniref:hypothetical protein n=1 Tax=Archangium violaceum TaxID=83451 RepID=UPI002B2C5AE3|nr:hypothetical protein F0U61_37450 [Archangium violaceum]
MGSNINRANNTLSPLAIEAFRKALTEEVQKVRWKDAKVVDQLNPEGATPQTYRNGVYNCAGAVAATVARALGTRQDQTDADLINDLSRDRTSSKGTTAADMTSMLKEVGAKVDGKVITGRYTDNRLNSLLAKGDKVVAQVGVRNESTGKYDPHYVLIDGKDKKGNYIIKDPLKGTYSATAQQLRSAVNHAPGAGGVLIPIKPADEGVAKAAEKSAKEVKEAKAPVTPDPFKTDESKVAGKDTTFKPYLTDSYQDYTPPAPVELKPQDTSDFKPQVPTVNEAPQKVTPGTAPESYAQSVLGLLNSEDLGVKELGQELYSDLKTSANPVDKRADEVISEQFAKQPGIGQKVKYNGYGD